MTSEKNLAADSYNFISMVQTSIGNCTRFDPNYPGFRSSGKCLTMFEEIIGKIPKVQHPQRPMLQIDMACSKHSFFKKKDTTNESFKCDQNKANPSSN